MGKRFVWDDDFVCVCPLTWHSWGVQLTHTRNCPVYQGHHPLETWLRNIPARLKGHH